MSQDKYSTDPQAYDIDLATLVTSKRAMWNRQEMFLAAFGGRGTLYTSAQRVGLSHTAIWLWQKDNALRFNDRFEAAQSHFNNILEDKALELALGLKPGQNVTPLAILMNGNMPEKYKQNVVVSDDTAKQALSEIQKLRKERRGSPDSNETLPDGVSPIRKQKRG